MLPQLLGEPQGRGRGRGYVTWSLGRRSYTFFAFPCACLSCHLFEKLFLFTMKNFEGVQSTFRIPVHTVTISVRNQQLPFGRFSLNCHCSLLRNCFCNDYFDCNLILRYLKYLFAFFFCCFPSFVVQKITCTFKHLHLFPKKHYPSVLDLLMESNIHYERRREL